MAFKEYCPNPKCKKQEAIYYGKRHLLNGTTYQRVYCLSCKKTSTLSQASFFRRMRVTPDKFHDAIGKYSIGIRIAEIARTLKTKPNTIINWIRKVHDDPENYNSYLKNFRTMDYYDRRKFFRSLLRIAKHNNSRLITSEHLERLEKVSCWPNMPEGEGDSFLKKMDIYEKKNPDWY